MPLAPMIVLHSPISDGAKLPPFVEQCLADSVELIAVVGPGCDHLEDQIDWLVVGDGANADRFIVTSSHPREKVAEVLDFAAGWHSKAPGRVEEVKL